MEGGKETESRDLAVTLEQLSNLRERNRPVQSILALVLGTAGSVAGWAASDGRTYLAAVAFASAVGVGYVRWQQRVQSLRHLQSGVAFTEGETEEPLELPRGVLFLLLFFVPKSIREGAEGDILETANELRRRKFSRLTVTCYCWKETSFLITAMAWAKFTDGTIGKALPLLLGLFALFKGGGVATKIMAYLEAVVKIAK